jgi:hypothetical protein
MLDGSAQSVSIAGQDPFAVYHTPIAGKKRGRLTVIGYLGVSVGLLFSCGGLAMFVSGTEAEASGALSMFLIGAGFVVASYLWARR